MGQKMNESTEIEKDWLDQMLGMDMKPVNV